MRPRDHPGARGVLAGCLAAFLLALAPGGTLEHVSAAAPPSSSTASTASRSRCPSNLAERLAATGRARQLITVEASVAATTYATLERFSLVGGCWVLAAAPEPARVGHAGLSAHHLEGDGTTPIGAFGIGPTMYGTEPDPGVAYGYHRLTCGDWWDEQPGTASYNRFVHVACGTAPPFGGGSEALWTEAPAYDFFALIDYNTSPIVSGRGSAIFLHVSTGGPTDGCVSEPLAALVATLRWLRPADHPLVVVGTASGIASR